MRGRGLLPHAQLHDSAPGGAADDPLISKKVHA
jgi:hypothetical protein